MLRSGAARSLSLAAFLFLFWILLSGFLTPFLLIAGACCAAAVVYLARRMHLADHEGHPVQLGPGVFTYWPWLFLEIFRSGWQVSKIILHPRLPISPVLVRFAPRQRTTAGLVTHANSITLTPGTITVQADSREFVVHALVHSGAQGLADSEMSARIERLEAGR